MTRKRAPEISHVEPAPGEPSFVCRRGCKKTWPNRHEFTSDGSMCRNCRQVENRKYYSTSKSRSRHLTETYGLTEGDFHDRLKGQKNQCGACGCPINYKQSSVSGTVLDRAVIDHDHQTGKVRGLLCGRCNVGIGYFQDSIDNLQGAIDYLRNPPTPPKPRFWGTEPLPIAEKCDLQGNGETTSSEAEMTLEERQKRAGHIRTARRLVKEIAR